MDEKYLYGKEVGSLVVQCGEEEFSVDRNVDLEEKYFLEEKLRTSVKNQTLSNCWAYANCDMIQTYLLYNKIIDNNSDFSDLSELFLTYDMFQLNDVSAGIYYNKHGNVPKADGAYGATNGEEVSLLSRNIGIVPEFVDPDFSDKQKSPLTPRKTEICEKKFKKFLIKEIRLLADPDARYNTYPQNYPHMTYIRKIKECIKEYGAVSLSTYLGPKYINKEINPKLNQISKFIWALPNNNCPNKVNDAYGFHELNAVGWDDTIEIPKFNKAVGKDMNEYEPACKGAFIVKNSWGGSDLEGYYYLSYSDPNIIDAFYISEVLNQEANSLLLRKYNNNYGMLHSFDYTEYNSTKTLEKKVNFQRSYITESSDEILYAVGLYNGSPCLATVTVKVGDKTWNAVSGHKLDSTGYHVIDIKSPINLGEKGRVFTIFSTYEQVGIQSVTVPIERQETINGKKRYPFLNTKSDDSTINGKTIKTINQNEKTEFGDVAIQALTKPDKGVCDKLKEASNQIKEPRIDNGRIDDYFDMESQIFNLPKKLSTGEVIEWRNEPVDYDRYTNEISYIKKYSNIDGKDILGWGFVNTHNKDQTAILTAIVYDSSDKNWNLKKIYKLSLPPVKENQYKFNIRDGYSHIIVNGRSLPGGCQVKISTESNHTMSVKANRYGFWEATISTTYEVQNIKIDVEVYVKEEKENNSNESNEDNLILIESGTQTIKRKKPYEPEETPDGKIIFYLVPELVVVGLRAAIMAYISEGLALKAGAEIVIPAGVTGLSLIGETVQEAIYKGDLSKLELKGAGEKPVRIETNARLFDTIKGIENIEIILKEAKAITSVFSKNIASGGYIRNCRIIGKVESMGAFCGLIEEGNKIEISNCNIEIDAMAQADCAGIAKKLSGNSIVENCEFVGRLCGSGVVSGIANEQADDAKILNCAVIAELKGNSVSGIIGKMENQAEVLNCLSSCRIEVTENGQAFGIGQGMADKKEAIRNNVSICSYIGGKNPFRVSAYGKNNIAYEGICCDKGSSFSAADHERLKTARAFGESSLFTELGWDLNKKWKFDDMLFIKLAQSIMKYYYPFIIPRNLKNGILEVNPNEEIILHGVKNAKMKEVSWRNLSAVHTQANGNKNNSNISENEFICETGIGIKKEGSYSLELFGLIGTDEHSQKIEIKVIDPSPKMRKAVVLFKNRNFELRSIKAQGCSFGQGDFTVEGWIKFIDGGTIISQKPTAGGYGNGGFLLVIKKNGILKFATDNGYGYYEANSKGSMLEQLQDKKYHHVLALRKSGALEIYFDFKKIEVEIKKQIETPANVTNQINISIGSTEQVTEKDNYFGGCIGECRIWNIAKTYSNIQEWEMVNTNEDKNGLVSLWDFADRDGTDRMSNHNNLDIRNVLFEEWKLKD